jgi:uncharacterized membrane protein YeaQ/YmgE (transglycosylase-associated protein family)
MIGFIVAGLIIGMPARLIKPGKQRLGIIATLLLGLAGSVAGGTAGQPARGATWYSNGCWARSGWVVRRSTRCWRLQRADLANL